MYHVEMPPPASSGSLLGRGAGRTRMTNVMCEAFGAQTLRPSPSFANILFVQ